MWALPALPRLSKTPGAPSSVEHTGPVQGIPSFAGMARRGHAPNSHGLEGTQREEVFWGRGCGHLCPHSGGVWQRGVDEFWDDANFHHSWDMPSVTATRELRPVTVVTRGGHVPGIWDVSGSLYGVGALESQGRTAFRQKAYPAKAWWWVTGAGWGGSSPNLALADSLQLCGTLGAFSTFTRHRNPCPPCYPPPSVVHPLTSP